MFYCFFDYNKQKIYIMVDLKGILLCVVYFCMEYGLDNCFKVYVGGLGIFVGDYMKGVKQYDYFIVGIGIKWK